MKNKFPSISDTNIKEGIFIGPQIRELIQEVKFENKLSELEKQHGNHSKVLLLILGGNYKAENCVIWWLILYHATKL